MPGQDRKHLQLAEIGAADAWLGLEASAICWNWICRCISWVRKHLQFAGIGFADAWPGSEASATCWNWICRCLAGVGSICNLLELDLQMPSRGRKHLQLAGIGFADTYRGELRTWKHLQLVGIGFADAWSGSEASAICWNWICRCLVGIGSICNLLELDL